MVRFLQIVVLLAVLAALANCIGGDNNDLVFRQRPTGESRSEAPQRDEDDQIVSSVDISEHLQKPLNLVVLPFRNISGVEELRSGLYLFHSTLSSKLREMNRLFNTVIMRETDYEDMASGLGRPDDLDVARSVAFAMKEMMNADLVLYGGIRLGEGKITIEPKLISFEGSASAEEDLNQIDVDFSNITNLGGDVTDSLIDYLISRQQ